MGVSSGGRWVGWAGGDDSFLGTGAHSVSQAVSAAEPEVLLRTFLAARAL